MCADVAGDDVMITYTMIPHENTDCTFATVIPLSLLHRHLHQRVGFSPASNGAKVAPQYAWKAWDQIGMAHQRRRLAL